MDAATGIAIAFLMINEIALPVHPSGTTSFYMSLQDRTVSFLKSTFSLLLMSGAFCCWILLCVWAIGYLSGDSKNQSGQSGPAAVAMATDSTPQVKVTNELRYTAMGWQTPSHWMRQPTQGSQLSIAGLNPVVLGIGILLASLLAIVLFSPDQEVERLLKAATLRDEATASYKLDRLRETNRK